MKTELTNIWKVNNTLVVADTIEDAIIIYRNHSEYFSIKTIEKITDIDSPALIESYIKAMDE